MLHLLVCAAIAAGPSDSATYAPSGIVAGANATAMGGVGVAASDDNIGISLNPGLLALHGRYDVTGLFGISPGEGISWGATAMDARTSEIVAAGFAYGGERVNAPLSESDLPGWVVADEEVTNYKRFHDFTGAIAVPLLDRKLSLGFGVSATYWDQERLGTGWWWNGHIGAAVRPVEALTIGVVGRNLTPSTKAARDPEVLGGARLDAKGVLSLEVDGGWQAAHDEPLLAAGVEKIFAAQGRLRGGWRYEGGEHALSLGLGWTEAGGSIEYGVVIPVSTDKLTFGSTLHQFSVRFAAPQPIKEE